MLSKMTGTRAAREPRPTQPRTGSADDAAAVWTLPGTGALPGIAGTGEGQRAQARTAIDYCLDKLRASSI